MQSNSPIPIGNGGAGIVGFVQYMYQMFNEVHGTNYPFEWKKSDTEETLNGLIEGTLPIGWPYAIDRVCEAYQAHTDILTEPAYLFRDHFVLAGPKANPAALPSPETPHPHVSNDAVYAMFKTISEGREGVKFLTRNDLSATNVLEREIFRQVLGRYPDIETDPWYIPPASESHYPDAALAESNQYGYYTLSDRGIWTWADPAVKSDLILFCEGGDTDADDLLLNACLVVTRKDAPEEAQQLKQWLCTDGQDYVERYLLHDDRLYTKAPADTLHPCKGNQA